MAFTVPTIEPASATGLAAGDTIEAASIEDVVLRDRFLFATRRRLIASLGSVTTSAASYEVAYGFQAITLPTSNGSIMIGFVATDDASVKVTTSYGSVGLTTGGPGSIIGTLSGIPQATWFGVTVQVQSNTGGAVTIHGIYIAEQVLTDTDLP